MKVIKNPILNENSLLNLHILVYSYDAIEDIE